jgi:hypothetical protein
MTKPTLPPMPDPAPQVVLRGEIKATLTYDSTRYSSGGIPMCWAECCCKGTVGDDTFEIIGACGGGLYVRINEALYRLDPHTLVNAVRDAHNKALEFEELMRNVKGPK